MKVECRRANAQSQSAPAQLLTDESELKNNTPSFNPSSVTLEATPKSPLKVTSTTDFEYKQFDISSAEKKRKLNPSTTRDDVNAEEFDNYTTGESSLCDSSRRSSVHRTHSTSSHSFHCNDKHRHHVSLSHGDVYSDHSTRRRYSRSNSRYNHRASRRSVDKGHGESWGMTRTSSRSPRRCKKGTVSTYSRHTTYSSYSYTTHHKYSHSYRHERVDSHYSETTHSLPTPPSSSQRSSSHHRDSSRNRERRQVSNRYDSYSYNDTRGGSSRYHSESRCPTPPCAAPHIHDDNLPPSSSGNHTISASKDLTTNHSAASVDPDNYRYYRELSYRDLPLEWWERTEHCKEAKLRHTDRIDHMCDSREGLVLKTTLWKEDTVLEPNMFPYYTPYGVEHYTLWSVRDLSHEQIVSFVDRWLYRHMPHVRRWQYDDNSGERSIDLFHVHVFIETAPFQYAPREGMLYIPPHAMPPTSESDRRDVELNVAA